MVAGLYRGPLIGDFGADAVDVEVHVYVVGHRLPVVVFHDQVLLKEAEGLPGRGRGEADDEGVEVVQHLPPEVVDRAVTFVGDDEVEGLDGNVGVVLDRRGLSSGGRQIEPGQLFELGVKFFALEHGVDALDGGDADAADGIDARRLEKLDVVKLGELAPAVGNGEALELTQRLAPQVGAVDQKEHTARSGVLDEAVDLVAGHEGLAAAGGHLHQGASASGGQGPLQTIDGPLLPPAIAPTRR